jgi:hypothetical protein
MVEILINRDAERDSIYKGFSQQQDAENAGKCRSLT